MTLYHSNCHVTTSDSHPYCAVWLCDCPSPDNLYTSTDELHIIIIIIIINTIIAIENQYIRAKVRQKMQSS